MTGTRLSLALLGSGEFLSWNEPVDRWLLDRSPNPGHPVLVLPTASAPEGNDVFERWGQMGLHHFDGLGIEAQVVPLRTRADADRPELAERLQRASMVFFSGGNPAYLARTLSGTIFWTALVKAMNAGLPYAGCSAGIASLGELAPDSPRLRNGSPAFWEPGLNVFSRTVLGPHWDTVNLYVPGLRERIVNSVPQGWRLLVVDEDTAVVGDGVTWRIMGSGGAGLYRGEAWQTWRSGDTFDVHLLGSALAL